MKDKAISVGAWASALFLAASLALAPGIARAVPPEQLPSYSSIFERLQSAFEQAAEAATEYYGAEADAAEAQEAAQESEAAPEIDLDAVISQEDVMQDGVIVGIAVRGEVGNPFIADAAEYARIAPMMRFRNTACFRHPVAANAQLDADVTGFSLVRLIQDAEPAEGVDTITFIALTGERLSVPLLSVQHPFSAIVLVPDDGDAQAEGGFSNRLWLDSASGVVAMTDVVAIWLTSSTGF
ncbi:MAG: hypothetical protein IKD70_06825 [Eggerthellaceae bacterium]|nr:hypothetical protein [Eggerthellaceae bacterium]